MNENQLRSPHHNTVRKVLQIGGPAIAVVGIIFMIVGIASFFSSFGGFGPPRYFWCCFVGIPLLFVGSAMSMMGFVGAFYRYFTGEAAPVAKDAANYMGEGIQPGVKAVAKAVTEGIMEAQKEEPPKP
jgi:hypothetical protein